MTRSARIVRALLVTCFVLPLCMFAATPAQAATVTCPPMSSNVCKSIVPIAECYWDNGNGTTAFVWGWNNPTPDMANITVGATFNKVTPADQQTQPAVFAPGRQRNAFVTTTSADTATWRLGNNTAQADNGNQQNGSNSGENGNLPRCATKPVSQVGNMLALALSVLVLVATGLTVLSIRNRRHEVTA